MRPEAQKKTKSDVWREVRQSEHLRLEKEVKLQALAKQPNTSSGKHHRWGDPHHQLRGCSPEQLPRRLRELLKASWRTSRSSHRQSSDPWVSQTHEGEAKRPKAPSRAPRSAHQPTKPSLALQRGWDTRGQARRGENTQFGLDRTCQLKTAHSSSLAQPLVWWRGEQQSARSM